MDLDAGDPASYLGHDDVIDIPHPCVQALVQQLSSPGQSLDAYARRAYKHVRDEVAHSFDAGNPRVTIAASQVAEHRVGLCYAKSHLLVALLRARGIPAGLCYQRLVDPDQGYVLHGLVAVWLDGTWHRLDVRGNKAGVDAQFSVRGEQVAYTVDPTRGEVDYPTVHVSPPPAVLAPLRAAHDVLTDPLAATL